MGRGDPALERLHDVRDLEVHAGEVGHGLVGELLHPGLQGVGALELPRRIVVQDLLGFVDRWRRAGSARPRASCSAMRRSSSCTPQA